MSQWNNSYPLNNQYQQPALWNCDGNEQYANQGYYPNRQYDSGNQYVSFNEFISQMQTNGAAPANTANFNSVGPVHQQQYPVHQQQYNYQNMPSTSQNVDYDYSSNASTSAPPKESSVTAQSQSDTVPESNAYKNEMVFKSTLTPTATEFVPKSTTVKEPNTSRKAPLQSTSNHNGFNEHKPKRSSSSDTNWRDRSQPAPSSNYRQYENREKNNETNYKTDRQNTREYNQRNPEVNNRNDRNQSKFNSRNKNIKDDPGRTFYNSAINKDGSDTGRYRRGEGSGRNRNFAGSQRIHPVERSSVDDEQYANSYLLYKDEKPERIPKQESTSSPIKHRNNHKNVVEKGANKEMTQRERLTDQLDRGTLECLVCCERVKQIDSVWSCGNCFHVLHLRCIRKWAMSSIVEGKWRCPACQNTNQDIPTDYRCMCGATRNPEYQRGSSVAHTCGQACQRPRVCVHPCTLLCHPGPCPPCQATVNKQCGCGAETRSILCSSKLPQVCGRVCKRKLDCGVHECTKECHEGPCEDCNETVTQVCYCPAGATRAVSCRAGTEAHYSCGASCARVRSCGQHVCGAPCHAPPCEPCARAPAARRTCPCGHTKIEEGSRKSCTDPIPLCGNICASPLTCGPFGDKHFCKELCHEGDCPVCPEKTVVQCRCGHSSREVPCADLPSMMGNVLCQKKCNKKLSCGRHRCRTACCADTAHRCAVLCGRALSCQLHRCQQFCHTGHCAPCPRLSFDELTCECGAEVLYPPIRCGAKPPPCSAECRRPRPCGHPPHHSCHSGDCPPCVVLTTKRCYGEHEERKTIPCSQDEFSCGLPCGKPLPCGKHTCIKTCHKGPCDTGKCTQPCTEKRPSCGHECAAPCHSSSGRACPSELPCRRSVRATCPCRRRAASRACHDNARDLHKLMSALTASKIQEGGGSVDISEVQKPDSMLRTLECDDECRQEARARQLALALQIRNPDVSAKLAPRYTEHARATAAREPAFAQTVHDQLTSLVQLAKKSKQKTRSHSFPSMNRQKRQFIHELCEQFGCESVAYDAEPNRNVVATADKEKSWLPAMSVLEVLAREAGRRRVPAPVLRPPALHAPPAKSSSGWATLTSSNAWASRSQPKPAEPAKIEKIDYFDNPPEN